MDLHYSDEDRAFRDEARAWLATNVPRENRPTDPVAAREFDTAWQRAQHDAGYAGIAWPAEFGGRGASLVQQMLWHQEYAAAGGPWIGACFVGVNHGGPTLIMNGTDGQRRDHLPRILRGEAVWCQGFSEPGAGSDLAGISTRGEVDGDDLVVTGQKIWTSFADVADHQELLIRTDPDSQRHRGLSWVICDMDSPGIEVRPIRTMSRNSEFAEVFYDEVRIPLCNVVGGLDNGWAVAMSTLGFERGSAFMADQVELSTAVDRLIDLVRTSPTAGGGTAIEDGGVPDDVAERLAEAAADVAALRAMTLAGISRNLTGQPGAEGSMIRVFFAELSQRVAALAMDVLGAASLEFVHREDHGWTGTWLWRFAETIGGGTSDIQRNIIGDRVLGLPR